MPFAIGEEFSSKWAFAPFVEEGLLNFARVDVSNVGGLTEAKKVAGWCEAHYVDLMPHNPLGPITTAATIHLAAALPNLPSWSTSTAWPRPIPPDLFPTMPALDGDSFPLPTAPGLGVTFDERRRRPCLRVLGGAALAAAGRELHELVAGTRRGNAVERA